MSNKIEFVNPLVDEFGNAANAFSGMTEALRRFGNRIKESTIIKNRSIIAESAISSDIIGIIKSHRSTVPPFRKIRVRVTKCDIDTKVQMYRLYFGMTDDQYRSVLSEIRLKKIENRINKCSNKIKKTENSTVF